LAEAFAGLLEQALVAALGGVLAALDDEHSSGSALVAGGARRLAVAARADA
jgi:hypothetical protein